MSVWSTCTYKTTIPRRLYEINPKLLEAFYGTHINQVLKTDVKLSNLPDNATWENLASECHWSFSSSPIATVNGFLTRFKAVKYHYRGTCAIYKMVKATYKSHITAPVTKKYNKAYMAAHYFVDSTIPYSQITPRSMRSQYDMIDKRLIREAQRISSVADAFKNMKKAMRARMDEPIEAKTRKLFGDSVLCYEFWIYGDLVFAIGKEEYSNQCLILAREHITLLIAALLRIANIFKYIGCCYRDDSISSRAIIKVLEQTIKKAGDSNNTSCFTVARAFHKAKAYTRAKFLGSLIDGTFKSMEEDFFADGLGKHLNLKLYAKEALKHHPSLLLDVLDIYRWMPPPDFDCYKAFQKYYDYHHSTRSSGADTNATNQMREYWASIKLERKRNLLAAYKARYSYYPVTLEKKGENPTDDEIAAWDHRGLLDYTRYRKDLSKQVKDKATICASMDMEIEESRKVDRDPFKKNYLLWFLMNNKKVDLAEIDMKSSGEENIVKGAYKAESHKPDSRIFGMAPPYRRTLLGEVEGNLSRIATFWPGSLMGKNTVAKTAHMRDLFDSLKTVTDRYEKYTTVFIQFDLAKFSTRSNGNVTKDYHSFWGEVYGEERVTNAFELGCKSKILHTTEGIVMHYQNKGADIEGFRGRMQTMFHADMMSAAVRIAKRRKVIYGGAKLAVFIDDGALKVAIPHMRDGKETEENFKKNANEFLQIMSDVYAAGGQELHPDKTIVSIEGGEMLSELYYRRVKIPAGLKAAMRLYSDVETPTAALSEDLMALASTSQGMVKAGADVAGSYFMYAMSCYEYLGSMAMKNFGRVSDERLAILGMIPKSFGGLGMMSIQAICSTTEQNATSMGLAMLNSLCKSRAGAVQIVKNLMNKGFIQNDNLTKLRTPMRVRLATPVLVESRLKQEVIEVLSKGSKRFKAVLNDFNDIDLKKHAESVADALFTSKIVSLQTIQRVWALTPLAYVESLIAKFKSSQSVQGLIGHAMVRKIRKRNRNDVDEILKAIIVL